MLTVLCKKQKNCWKSGSDIILNQRHILHVLSLLPIRNMSGILILFISLVCLYHTNYSHCSLPIKKLTFYFRYMYSSCLAIRPSRLHLANSTHTPILPKSLPLPGQCSIATTVHACCNLGENPRSLPCKGTVVGLPQSLPHSRDHW